MVLRSSFYGTCSKLSSSSLCNESSGESITIKYIYQIFLNFVHVHILCAGSDTLIAFEEFFPFFNLTRADVDLPCQAPRRRIQKIIIIEKKVLHSFLHLVPFACCCCCCIYVCIPSRERETKFPLFMHAERRERGEGEVGFSRNP